MAQIHIPLKPLAQNVIAIHTLTSGKSDVFVMEDFRDPLAGQVHAAWRAGANEQQLDPFFFYRGLCASPQAARNLDGGAFRQRDSVSEYNDAILHEAVEYHAVIICVEKSEIKPEAIFATWATVLAEAIQRRYGEYFTWRMRPEVVQALSKLGCFDGPADESRTAHDYFQALRTVLGQHITSKQEEMLREHFNAPNHTATWQQLAEKVGYEDFNTVNLQYGKFAGRVARELGFAKKRLDPNGRSWWLWLLVDWADKTDATGHQAFVLLPEAVEALERLKFGIGTQGTGRSNPPPLPTDKSRFYVCYHNYDELGYLPGEYETDEADLATLDTSSYLPSCISTVKGIIRDTVGNVIFLIVGYGAKPKKYILWSWCMIDEVRPGEDGMSHAEGSSGGVLNPPALLNAVLSVKTYVSRGGL